MKRSEIVAKNQEYLYRRKTYKIDGVWTRCCNCSSAELATKTMCVRCRDLVRAAAKRQRQRKQEGGICVDCSAKAVKRLRCLECAVKNTKRSADRKNAQKSA